MVGRAAYQAPEMLLDVDARFFGAERAVPDAAAALALYMPYMARKLETGVRLHDMTRHLLGLFTGLPGARAWRRHLATEGVKPGAGLDVVRSLNVLQARPLRTNAEFELYTLQKFNTYLHIHRVSASILSAGYVPILYPNHALFPGLVADISAQARAATLQDIRNPQFAGTDGTGGVFRLQPGGDYQTESGQQLITKLVVRRLTTDPDAFFHLVPGTYGLGLALKERYPLGDLTAFKAAIERQVLREPEIVECAAQVSLTAGGVLTIILRARLAAGTQVTIPLPPIPSAFTAT